MRTLVVALVLSLAPLWAFACSPDKVRLNWDGGMAEFKVDIVDTPEGRARGLMFVEKMPRFSGMLFVYPKPQNNVSFWMRNTLISLDILFFDERGVLQSVQENAVPLDETSLPGGDGIQYVLEINGGLVEKLRIPTGALLQSSAIDQESAQSKCDAN